jgi:hypothetical protein
VNAGTFMMNLKISISDIIIKIWFPGAFLNHNFELGFLINFQVLVFDDFSSFSFSGIFGESVPLAAYLIFAGARITFEFLLDIHIVFDSGIVPCRFTYRDSFVGFYW